MYTRNAMLLGGIFGALAVAWLLNKPTTIQVAPQPIAAAPIAASVPTDLAKAIADARKLIAAVDAKANVEATSTTQTIKRVVLVKYVTAKAKAKKRNKKTKSVNPVLIRLVGTCSCG